MLELESKKFCRICKKTLDQKYYEYWSDAWREEEIKCESCLRKGLDNEHDVEQERFSNKHIPDFSSSD